MGLKSFANSSIPNTSGYRFTCKVGERKRLRFLPIAGGSAGWTDAMTVFVPGIGENAKGSRVVLKCEDDAGNVLKIDPSTLILPGGVPLAHYCQKPQSRCRTLAFSYDDEGGVVKVVEASATQFDTLEKHQRDAAGGWGDITGYDFRAVGTKSPNGMEYFSFEPLNLRDPIPATLQASIAEQVENLMPYLTWQFKTVQELAAEFGGHVIGGATMPPQGMPQGFAQPQQPQMPLQGIPGGMGVGIPTQTGFPQGIPGGFPTQGMTEEG